jgi:hypothetical protein
MAQPRMTEAYHTNRNNLIEALAKWWGSVEDINHLGAKLLQSLAHGFSEQAGMLEGELFERCPKCTVVLAPDGTCENRKCDRLPAQGGDAKVISN